MEKLILLTIIVVAFAQTMNAPVWPHPRQYIQTTPGTYAFLQKSNFQFIVRSTNGIVNDLSQFPELREAITLRYPNRIFFDYIWQRFPMNITFPSFRPQLYSVEITIQDLSQTLSFGVDEAYTLSVDEKNGIKISSLYVWGALRGLETLSQLVQNTDFQDWYYIANVPITVDDKPRFPWRGLMIDTARHYLPMNTILRVIDTMEYNKMNVLHLHLTDAESFPVEIKQFPNLNGMGAWANSLTYTQDSLRKIVDYARFRGIRVIPEFDMPGHTNSWGKGYPEVVANCPSRSSNPNNVALNPLVNTTMQIVNAILNEMNSVFTDEYMHLGGDEVIYSCWKEDPMIRNYMDVNGITPEQLQAQFQVQVAQIMTNIRKKMIAWHELITLNTTEYVIDKESIIQVWKDQAKYLGRILDNGYRAILSDGWYLDRQIPVDNKTSWQFLATWKHMYGQEVENLYELTPVTRLLVLGGEATMWGEGIDDSNIDSMIWPRASAVAERLWSPMEINSIAIAEPRLIRFACQVLKKRGIRSGPIKPDFCPYMFPRASSNRGSGACEAQTTGLIFFLISSVVLVITTILASLMALYFFKKHKQVKKAWMADVFTDNQILTSDHNELLLK